MVQCAKMARGGQHRFAQAYAKNWNRKIRGHAESDEMAYNVSNNFVNSYNVMYNHMGAQDQMEQAVEMSQPQKQFAEDKEEAAAPKKSGGFFSSFFGGFGSKAEPKKSTTEVAGKISSSANSYVPQKKSQMSDQFAHVSYQMNCSSSKTNKLSSSFCPPIRETKPSMIIKPNIPKPQKQQQEPIFGGGMGSENLNDPNNT